VQGTLHRARCGRSGPAPGFENVRVLRRRPGAPDVYHAGTTARPKRSPDTPAVARLGGIGWPGFAAALAARKGLSSTRRAGLVQPATSSPPYALCRGQNERLPKVQDNEVRRALPAHARARASSAARAFLWIYGHTHESEDTTIGYTRVVSNSKGYGPWLPKHRARDNPRFDPNYVVEI
jgi:hypothetical protein